MSLSQSKFPRFSLPLVKYLRAHHFTRAGLVLLGIGAAIVFFVAGAALRLLIGPVSLGPFGGTLSDAIANALPGITVKYDQAAVEWSREEGRVTLAILGARVFDSEGRIIAQAPKADIDLAARPFLEGKIEVRRITLDGVELTLVRTHAGGLRLGVESDKSQQDIIANLTDAIKVRSTKSSSLQSFAVHNARIAILDEITGLFVVAPRADLKIALDGPNLVAKLDSDIEISGKPARVTADLTLPPVSGPVSGDVSLKGLDVAALAANTKTFDYLKKIDVIADLSASYVIDHGSHFASADFGFDAHGTVTVPGLTGAAVPVREARVVGRYDGTSNRLLIDDAMLDSGGASAHLTGKADFRYDPDAALAQVAIDATADQVRVNDPRAFSSPLVLDHVALRGSYLTATNDIVLDHLALHGGTLTGDLAGKVTLVPGESPAIALQGRLGALPVHDLVRDWPLTVGQGARAWIAENIFAGSVGPITLETHMPAGILDQPVVPDGALNVTFPVTGVEARYVDGLTHLTQVNGRATLTGNTFSADIYSGRIGPLVVSKGHAVIANLSVPGAPGDITAHVDGSMQDVLALIDQKPLNYPTRFGISPSDTKGTAGLDLSFHVPMRKNLNVADIGISVKAQVTGFDIALGTRGRLTNGDVNFAIDNNKLVGDGTVQLADSRMAVDWTETFQGTGNTTHVTAKGTLSAPARAMLGLDGGDILDGPTGVDATLVGRRGHFTQGDITADLAPATISAGLLGLEKAPGIPSSAHVLIAFAQDGSIKSADTRIAGPGTSIIGTASFSKDGTLTGLNVPTVRVGAVDDYSLNYTRNASGITVIVRGKTLDGTNLARRGSATGPVGPNATSSDNVTLKGPFHIDARIDRLVLRDGVVVSPFALNVSGISDRLSALSLSGALPKGGMVYGELQQTAAGRQVGFSTTDAGMLARGLFGLNGMRGGEADLTVALPGRATDTAPRGDGVPDYEGKITAKNFTLVDQPFVARLLMSASFVGVATLLGGQGIAVDSAEVPFSSKNGVIAVHDAIATGPTVGATADGYVDRPKNAIAIKGTLAPVVGVNFNQVLGAIPVVGNILVSKKGEGIFGVTYSVKGNADQPSVSVNPLAMLTPGILRRIFQGRMPTAAQAPSNAPAAQSPPPLPPAPVPKGL